jgi:hypothetical protein
MSRTVRPEVATFVAQVRASLSDLSPEEVEELTGGLDADLEERLEDTGPGTAPPDLGDPSAYAAELRAAAGLPPRGAGGGRRAAGPGQIARGVAHEIALTWKPAADAVRRQPWWPQFRESVVALRPAWWIARAWVAWWMLQYLSTSSSRLLPSGFGTFVLLLVAVGVSVALGRGLLDRRLRLDRPWAPVLLTLLNAFAAVVLLPALSSVGSDVETIVETQAVQDQGGLVVDGNPVRNIFAYDAQGRPIPLVQLYDQDGRPLDVAHEPYTDAFGQQAYTGPDGRPVAPFVDDRSRNRWNVFPLPLASYPEPLYGENDGEPTATASASVAQPPAPLVAVPPITGILGFPSSSPTVPGDPSASSGASSGPATSGASSTATTSPTSSPSASASRTPAVTRS